MRRRQALALFGSAGVAAVVAACRPHTTPQTFAGQEAIFPIALRNAQWPPTAQLPSGIGLGVNTWNGYTQEIAIDKALDRLRPAWWYHWRAWPLYSDPAWCPMAYPTPNWPDHPPYPMDVAQLTGWRGAMERSGANPLYRTWLVANEPEFTAWTPEQSAEAVAWQWRQLESAGLKARVVTPNGNIAHSNPARFEYLRAFCAALDDHGVPYDLGIHAYAHDQITLEKAWSEFCAWFDVRYGHSKRVVVTECGAGPNRPMVDWLAIMPWFYDLSEDHRVAGVAPFAAYPQTDTGHGAHYAYPGMIDDGQLTMYGHQYRSRKING